MAAFLFDGRAGCCVEHDQHHDLECGAGLGWSGALPCESGEDRIGWF